MADVAGEQRHLVQRVEVVSRKEVRGRGPPSELLRTLTGASGVEAALLGVRAFEPNGAPDRIRTCDLRLRRPSLYPAELRVPSHPLSPRGCHGSTRAKASQTYLRAPVSSGAAQGCRPERHLAPNARRAEPRPPPASTDHAIRTARLPVDTWVRRLAAVHASTSRLAATRATVAVHPNGHVHKAAALAPVDRPPPKSALSPRRHRPTWAAGSGRRERRRRTALPSSD